MGLRFFQMGLRDIFRRGLGIFRETLKFLRVGLRFFGRG